MWNRVDSSHNGFDAYSFDIFPNFISCFIIWIFSIGVNILQNRSKASFVANVSSVSIFILDESICFFVNSVIGKVHAQVVEVAASWTLVLLCGKPGQALFVNETAQRVDSCDQNIDSQIELQAINEIRLVQVALSYIVFTLHDPVAITRQEYAFTLAHCLRFYYEGFGTFMIKLFFETFWIGW